MRVDRLLRRPRDTRQGRPPVQRGLRLVWVVRSRRVAGEAAGVLVERAGVDIRGKRLTYLATYARTRKGL